MRVHRNAKTTPKMRQLIVTRAAAGLDVRPYRRGARHQCADRREMGGAIAAGDGLSDGSSRPQRQPRRLAAPVEAAIVALRRTRATAWQISTALRLPRSTVTRVLRARRPESPGSARAGGPRAAL